MACKEFAEKTCKSFPNCDGCNAHTTSKNLVTKRKLPQKIDSHGYKEGEYDLTADALNHDLFYQYGNASATDGKMKHIWMTGPIVDRLHEFEKLGYEPEELKKILETHDRWKRILNSVHGGCQFKYQNSDSLKHMEIEMRLFENCGDKHIDYSKPREPRYLTHAEIEELAKTDIPSLYPQVMMATAHRPLDKKVVYIFTSGVEEDSPMVKKIKEFQEYCKHDIESTAQCRDRVLKENPFLTKSFNVPTKGRQIIPNIRRVIFNNPATIVFWADGDKTVVKCQNGEPYDPEKGLAMAISKKALGNGNKWYNEFKKQLKNYEEPKLTSVEIEIGFDAEEAITRIRESAQKATDAFIKLAEDIGCNKGETPV